MPTNEELEKIATIGRQSFYFDHMVLIERLRRMEIFGQMVYPLIWPDAPPVAWEDMPQWFRNRIRNIFSLQWGELQNIRYDAGLWADNELRPIDPFDDDDDDDGDNEDDDYWNF